MITFSYSVCIAGSVNLTILHDNPDLKAVKYIINYGTIEQANPDNYPYTIEIRPIGGPVAGQSTTHVDLGEKKNGNYYFSVKIIYENGSESDFSENSFPLLVPKKPINLQVK